MCIRARYWHCESFAIHLVCVGRYSWQCHHQVLVHGHLKKKTNINSPLRFLLRKHKSPMNLNAHNKKKKKSILILLSLKTHNDLYYFGSFSIYCSLSMDNLLFVLFLLCFCEVSFWTHQMLSLSRARGMLLGLCIYCFALFFFLFIFAYFFAALEQHLAYYTGTGEFVMCYTNNNYT